MHKIKLSRACIGEEEKLAVNRVLTDGYLGMGQEVMFFEQELAAFFDNKVDVVCVNTGTSALQLALQACGISVGDEVLIPSITYVASFQATSATGATPIACDINLKTGCLGKDSIRKKINSRTKAIMYVHYASGLGDRDAIFEFAKEHNLRIIEDAAHSFGGTYAGQKIGTQGDITCFSFDGIKNITCGEGGAIVSNDLDVIEKVKDLRLLGVKKDTEQRYNGTRSWGFDVTDQGWRYHMSNVNAAIGREQLKKINYFGEKRRNLVFAYKEKLKDLPIDFLDIEYSQVVPHIFPVLVDQEIRDSLRDFLFKNNVETGIHYKPNHMLTKYRSHGCHNAEIFWNRVFSLPLHCNLTKSSLFTASHLIQQFLESRNNK